MLIAIDKTRFHLVSIKRLKSVSPAIDPIAPRPDDFLPILTVLKLRGQNGSLEIEPFHFGVRLKRPLWCAHDLFFLFDGSRWLISDDLACLVTTQQHPLPDPDFIATYLSSPENVTDRTPFCGINCIMPGTVILLGSDGSRTVEPTKDEAEPLDIADIPDVMADCIADACTDGRDLIVELSGGLDSTGIFYSAISVLPDRSRLHAVTFYDPRIDHSSDVKAAEAVCQKNGVALELLPLRPDGMVSSVLALGSYRPVRPSPWLLYSAPQHALLAYANRLSENAIIVNGHGGDHIFLAHPGAGAVVDHLWQRPPQIGKALQIAQKLAILKQQSWISVATECAADLGQRSLSALFRTPFDSRVVYDEKILTPECRRSIARAASRSNRSTGKGPDWKPPSRRRRIMMEAVQHGAADRLTDSRCPTLYPYLNRRLVNWAEHRPDSMTFSTRFNRLPQRTSFHQRYGDEIFLREGKGHITGVVQRMIRAESDLIIDLLTKGQAARLGYIDEESLRRDIRRCEMGSTFISPIILMLISLELYYKCWAEVL